MGSRTCIWILNSDLTYEHAVKAHWVAQSHHGMFMPIAADGRGLWEERIED